MYKRPPLRLLAMLCFLALLVVWIPVIQQLSPGANSAFSVKSWLILSAMASLGILLLFALLYLVSRRK